jgi:Flp pilus assembly protein TadD
MKKITQIVIVLLLPVIMFGQGNKAFLQANKAQERGHTVEALRLYQQSIEQGLMVWQSWNNIAVIHRNEKRYSEAEASVKEAISLKPDNAKLFVTLGSIYEAWKQYDEARTAYMQAKTLGSRQAGEAIQRMEKAAKR